MKLIVVLFALLSATPSAQALNSNTKLDSPEKFHFIESEKNTIQVFKKASPLVVSVDSTRIAADFFSMNYHEIPAGSGSGFIWDNKGHIITNFHVIQDAIQRSSSQISITTKDNQELKAKIIGFEPRKDIAVLKVNGLKLNAKGFKNNLANSKILQVGQKVLAIGNPFGFEQTLTQGVVSALDRSMPSVFSSVTIRNMIQTDASINPGNSGGPLLNSQGQLIGMNTSIISQSGSSAGIGFAVPSNTIHRIVNQIIKHGRVIQPGIGITRLDTMRTKMLKRYGYNIEKGVVIESVIPNSPAEQAGLKGLQYSRSNGVKLGDIITWIDNKEIQNYDDLYNILSEKQVGDNITLKIKRNGRTLTKELPLTALNQKI